MDQFDLLVQTLAQTVDQKELITIVRKLRVLGDVRAVPILIELLKRTDDGGVRNAAAVGLRDLKDNRAVPYLLELLKAKHTSGNRGTLMYALETLDASDAIIDIVTLMCAENYEVIAMAIRVLRVQIGNLQPATKSEAVQILQNCLMTGSYPQWKSDMLGGAIQILTGSATT